MEPDRPVSIGGIRDKPVHSRCSQDPVEAEVVHPVQMVHLHVGQEEREGRMSRIIHLDMVGAELMVYREVVTPAHRAGRSMPEHSPDATSHVRRLPLDEGYAEYLSGLSDLVRADLELCGVGEDIVTKLDEEVVEAFGVWSHFAQSRQKHLRAVLLGKPVLHHRPAVGLLSDLRMHEHLFGRFVHRQEPDEIAEGAVGARQHQPAYAPWWRTCCSRRCSSSSRSDTTARSEAYFPRRSSAS
jgi:hypothetical protein